MSLPSWLLKPTSDITVPQTAWSQATNLNEDRSFDADSTTEAELADVLGTLIKDLIAAKVLSVTAEKLLLETGDTFLFETGDAALKE